jgi:hypothetical protein
MGRLSPGQLTQALDHERYAHGQQGAQDDPFPEMEEQDHCGEHGQDQRDPPDRLDECAAQDRLGYDEQDKDDRQARPDVLGGKEDERSNGKQQQAQADGRPGLGGAVEAQRLRGVIRHGQVADVGMRVVLEAGFRPFQPPG